MVSNRDLNRAVKRVWSVHPYYRPRRGLDALVIDSSAFNSYSAHRQALELRENGCTLYTTQGVAEEVRVIGEQREGEVRQEMEELLRQCTILDVKTRGEKGDPLLKFENYYILRRLSKGITKGVAHEAVLDIYGDLYKGLEAVLGEERRHQEHVLFKHVAARILGTPPRPIIHGKEQYEQVRSCLRSLQGSIRERGSRELERLDERIPGQFDLRKYKGRNARRRGREPNLQYFFRKAVMQICHAIDDNMDVEAAKSEYQTAKRERRSTDRKVVLAAYAVVNLGRQYDKRVGIATKDPDQMELLKMRQCTLVDYTNFKELLGGEDVCPYTLSA